MNEKLKQFPCDITGKQVKVGDKVDKGDVLAWDDCFYTRDLTNPKRIVIKLGTMARIALVEDQFTFEDSIGITQKYADLNTTPYLKNNEFKIGYEQAIKLYVKVGDKVEYDQVLADVMDPSSAMFEEEGVNSPWTSHWRISSNKCFPTRL